MRNRTFKTALMLLIIITASTVTKAQSITAAKKDLSAWFSVMIVVSIAALITYTRVRHQKNIDREEKAKLKENTERNI